MPFRHWKIKPIFNDHKIDTSKETVVVAGRDKDAVRHEYYKYMRDRGLHDKIKRIEMEEI